MVRVRQRGEMQLEPETRPRRTSAVQDYAVDEVAFTWRARLRSGPFQLLRVVDRYIDGKASLQGRSLGLLRLDGESSPDTSVAQALLYLAELPWVPQAMRDNRRLEWGQVDHRSVEVATRVGSQRAVVRLEFDPAGDIIASRSRAPWSDEERAPVPRPWGADFWAYEAIGGVRVPTRGEMRWQLPDGSFTHWRATITSLEVR